MSYTNYYSKVALIGYNIKVASTRTSLLYSVVDYY